MPFPDLQAFLLEAFSDLRPEPGSPICRPVQDWKVYRAERKASGFPCRGQSAAWFREYRARRKAEGRPLASGAERQRRYRERKKKLAGK